LLITDYTPTQCLVNEYIGNTGIASHLDDPTAFGSVIAVVSLLEPIYYTFASIADTTVTQKVYVEPRSLLVLQGAVRYQWKHGITKARLIPHPTTANSIVRRRDASYRRLSITIRTVLDGRKRTSHSTDNTNTPPPPVPQRW